MNSVKKITSLKNAYELYKASLPERDKGIKTAIIRYLLPYPGFNLDFYVNADKPLSRQQTIRGLELSESIDIRDLSDVDRVLSWQEKVFISLGANPNVRAVFKSYLKHFLLWCKEKGLIESRNFEEWTIPTSYPNTRRGDGHGNKENYPITNRHTLVPYRLKVEQLSKSVQEQFREFEAFWREPHYSNRRPIPGAVEEMTHEICFRFILQILGWLALDKVDYYHQMRNHALSMQAKNPRYDSDWLLVSSSPPLWIEELNTKYSPRSIEQIKLEDLVPVVDTRPNNLDSWIVDDAPEQNPHHFDGQKLLDELQAELTAKDVSLSFGLTAKIVEALKQNQINEEIRTLRKVSQRDEAKIRMELAAQNAAQFVRSLLTDCIKWIKYQHNPLNREDGYRISSNYVFKFYHAEMNLAKFLYADITNTSMYPDYRDISVIMELRKMRSEEENNFSKPNDVNSVKRNPNWKEMGELLKKLLELCSPRLKVDERWDTNLGRLRPQRAVARDFQRYLVIMFFRIIAPDRQHVIRELRVHDTLTG